MKLRQLFDPKTFTFTYILASEKTDEAIIIDPVLSCFDRDIKLIKELEIDLKYIVETHHPFEHSSGLKNLKTSFPDALTASPEIQDSGLNDLLIKSEDEFLIGEVELKTIYTPGHTCNSVSFYTKGMVFTGDSLLIRSCGRSDLQGGNPEILFDTVLNKLFSLPENTLVYPGHDYNGFLISSIREEKLFNPLFCNLNKIGYVNFMNNYQQIANIQAVMIIN